MSYKGNELVFYVFTENDMKDLGKDDDLSEGIGNVMITPEKEWDGECISDSFEGEPFLENAGFHNVTESFFDYENMTREEAVDKLKVMGLEEVNYKI